MVQRSLQRLWRTHPLNHQLDDCLLFYPIFCKSPAQNHDCDHGRSVQCPLAVRGLPGSNTFQERGDMPFDLYRVGYPLLPVHRLMLRNCFPAPAGWRLVAELKFNGRCNFGPFPSSPLHDVLRPTSIQAPLTRSTHPFLDNLS